MANVTDLYNKDDLVIDGITVIDENCVLDRAYSDVVIHDMKKIKKKFRKLIKHFNLDELTKVLPDDKLHELYSSNIISKKDYNALLVSNRICELYEYINAYISAYIQTIKNDGIMVAIRDMYIDKYIFEAKVGDKKFCIPINISCFDNPLTFGECQELDVDDRLTSKYQYLIDSGERQLIDKCVKLNIINKYWSNKIIRVIPSHSSEYHDCGWDKYTKDRLNNNTLFPYVIDGKTIKR